jgi:hypothetical protein
MRQGLSLILTFSLFFSPLARGASLAPKNIRIQDYFVKPSVDFAWMTEKERAAYISFLYSLQILIDAELSNDLVVEIPESLKKTSKVESHGFRLNPIFSMEEANAQAVQLFKVLGTLIKTGTKKAASPALTYNAARSAVVKAGPNIMHQAEKNMGNAEIVAKPALENAASSAATATATATSAAGKSSTLKKVVAVTAGATVVGVAIDALTPPQQYSGQVPPPSSPAEAAPASGAVDATAGERSSAPLSSSSYRREGMFCIFGGHASAYKANGNRMTCPAPEGTINNSICAGSGFTPSFFCQSMGLSENTSSVVLTKKLCVPLRAEKGLSDLTIRCSEVFINDFLPSVKAVEPDKLAVILADIDRGLKAVETKRGIEDVGLLQYCGKGNLMNKNLQAGPCGALLKIMDVLRSEIPVLEKNVKAKISSAPAASGATAAPEVAK